MKTIGELERMVERLSHKVQAFDDPDDKEKLKTLLAELAAAKNNQTPTLGMKRVDLENSMDNFIVSEFKRLTADLIDLCETVKSKDTRTASIAQTHYETACMYAVKAAVTESRYP